jgi:hypothetical protein
MYDMITLILFLTCPKPNLINQSNEDWTRTDENSIKRAIKVCATDEHYSSTPCLKTFYKREPLTYAAICGAAHKRSW